MMVKSINTSPVPFRDIQRELEYLYARRLTIESLIRSIQEYTRQRPKVVEVPKRRVA
jgi:hypothetical protein